MTFWLKTEPEAAGADGRDLSLLFRSYAQLDALCDALGVRRVGSFVDEGEAAAELADWFPELDIAPAEDQPWADIADGVETFQALLEALLGNRAAVRDAIGVPEDALAGLMDELEYVLAVLEELDEGRFSLTPVS